MLHNSHIKIKVKTRENLRWDNTRPHFQCKKEDNFDNFNATSFGTFEIHPIYGLVNVLFLNCRPSRSITAKGHFPANYETILALN